MESTAQKKSPVRQLKDLGYPLMLIVFVLIVLALFFAAARFLSTNINSAISSPDEAAIQAQLTHINREDYDLIREKLQLPEIQPSGTGVIVPVEAPSTQGTTSQTTVVAPTAAAPQPAESKAIFSVAIFNSTKRSGVATMVKNDLTAAGYTVVKIGNKAIQEPQTLVQIKDRVQASPAALDEILSIVGKRFTIGDPQILESTSPYDIVITIGAK